MDDGWGSGREQGFDGSEVAALSLASAIGFEGAPQIVQVENGQVQANGPRLAPGREWSGSGGRPRCHEGAGHGAYLVKQVQIDQLNFR